jgi:hypothetical protein
MNFYTLTTDSFDGLSWNWSFEQRLTETSTIIDIRYNIGSQTKGRESFEGRQIF